MSESSTDEWEYCWIELVAQRLHWWSRRRKGTFVGMVRGRPTFCSAVFPIPSAIDADIAAFHALVAQMEEKGWEKWRGPRVRGGLNIFAVGYWDHMLRRLVDAPPRSTAAERETQS